MGQSRPRSRNSKWSSAPCLAVPSFHSYGNVCSMLPDLCGYFCPYLPALANDSCFSSRITSRSSKHVRLLPSFLSSVASKLTFFSEGPILLSSIICAHFHKEEVLFVVLHVFSSIKQRVSFCFHALQERVLRWMMPPTTSLPLGTLADLTRGKAELLAENALLRHQLIILRRQIKRPVYRKTDRVLLVFLARMVRTWKQALFLVQPETLLRWHRELFRVFWKHKSKARARKPRFSPETITMIKEMAANNRLWGAERIRGELLKLNIRVSKRTIQKYMRQGRPKRARGQT